MPTVFSPMKWLETTREGTDLSTSELIMCREWVLECAGKAEDEMLPYFTSPWWMVEAEDYTFNMERFNAEFKKLIKG